jgi:hypothetical protein
MIFETIGVNEFIFNSNRENSSLGSPESKGWPKAKEPEKERNFSLTVGNVFALA